MVHGSAYMRYRLYPELLERDMHRAYEGNGLEEVRDILLPRLQEGLENKDPERFFMWMPFARRLAQRIGYTP